VVRRLLAVGGFAAVGWLLGHAGQAHADTIPGPVAGSYSVSGVPDMGSILTTEHPARRAAAVTATVSGATPASPVLKAGGGMGGGVASGANQVTGDIGDLAHTGRTAVRNLTARPAAGLPGVRTTVPAKHTAPGRTQGISWARRPMGEAATIGNGATVKAAAPAPESGKGIRTMAHPVPAPGLPQPGNRQAGTTAGSRSPAESSGAPIAGHLFRAGSIDRPAPLVLAPVTGAVPPAVRTAADEPSFAPD
jgi:hypothetical protein